MTYPVGSRHENYGETGMAHLLEHLLSRGARRRCRASNIPTESARGAAGPPTPPLRRTGTNYFETFYRRATTTSTGRCAWK
ncbi:insulinase family protein [Cupriavidus basilensis]